MLMGLLLQQAGQRRSITFIRLIQNQKQKGCVTALMQVRGMLSRKQSKRLGQ